jgi:hypothetical protein
LSSLLLYSLLLSCLFLSSLLLSSLHRVQTESAAHRERFLRNASGRQRYLHSSLYLMSFYLIKPSDNLDYFYQK